MCINQFGGLFVKIHSHVDSAHAFSQLQGSYEIVLPLPPPPPECEVIHLVAAKETRLLVRFE